MLKQLCKFMGNITAVLYCMALGAGFGLIAATPVFGWPMKSGLPDMFGALIGAATAVIGAEWLRKRSSQQGYAELATAALQELDLLRQHLEDSEHTIDRSKSLEPEEARKQLADASSILHTCAIDAGERLKFLIEMSATRHVLLTRRLLALQRALLDGESDLDIATKLFGENTVESMNGRIRILAATTKLKSSHKLLRLSYGYVSQLAREMGGTNSHDAP